MRWATNKKLETDRQKSYPMDVGHVGEGESGEPSNPEGKALIDLLWASLGEEGAIDMVNKGKGKDKGGFNPGKGQWSSQSPGKGGKPDSTMNRLANMLRAIKGQGGKGWKARPWNQQSGKGWNNQGKGEQGGQPQGKGGQVQSKNCYNCGKPGHQAWQCWLPKQNRSINQVEDEPQKERDNLGTAGAIEWGDASLIESVPETEIMSMKEE